MGRPDIIYKHLPTWAQNGVVSTYGLYWRWLRFGNGYGQDVEEYLKREQFNKEDWEAYHRRKLGDILQSAMSVPYYDQVWTQSEKRAALSGRLEDLPLLDKDPIRENPKRFLRQDVPSWPRWIFHTSGSTGTPVASIWKVDEIRNSIALREARSARWAKVSFALPRATFSGRIVEPDPGSKGPFYRFNIVENQVYLSAFHLRAETAPMYVEALSKHRIQWLTGYAVSYYLLAKFILEQKLRVPPLKAVITTSEKLSPEMRQVVESAYDCPIYEEYSTVENAVFASECEKGRLHISPDVALVEILKPDGTPCKPGEMGEVVTTCLMRNYQLFIRYRLGDLAVWDDESCPCGRAMPVLKEVVGRIEDVVTGPDGRQMVRFHGVFVDQPNVREGQVIQETLDRIRVKVVPTNGFGPADVQDIIKRVRQRLGSEVEVNVQTVDQIARTKAGKFKAVVSLLPDQGMYRGKRTESIPSRQLES